MARYTLTINTTVVEDAAIAAWLTKQNVGRETTFADYLAWITAHEAAVRVGIGEDAERNLAKAGLTERQQYLLGVR